MSGLAKLKIKTILFSTIGVLFALTAAGAAYNTWRLTTAWQAANKASASNTTSDLLLEAAANWGFERGATSGALNAPVPASSDLRQQVVAHRNAADNALEKAMLQIRAMPNLRADPRVKDVEGAFKVVQDERRQVDVDFQKGRDGRDMGLRFAWFAMMTRLIDVSQRLRLATEFESDSIDARLAQLQSLKHYAWIISEYTGREGALVNGTIAAKAALSPQQMTTLVGYQGRIEMAWEAVQEIGATRAATPEITQAIAKIKQAFFSEFQQTRSSIFAASTAGAEYPISADEWFNRSTQATEPVLQLIQIGGREAGALASHTARISFYGFVVSIALLLLGLASGAVGWLIVNRRIVGPLRGMTDTMKRLSGGDTATEVPGVGRGDEIGDMAAAVQVFKENMIRADRLTAEQRVEHERKERRQETIDGYIKSFDASVSSSIGMLATAATELESTAHSMSATAEETSRQSTAAAAAAEQASANVQTVASATEELSASIAEIGGQVAESARVAGQAAEDAKRTDTQVQTLADAAQRIGDVVKLINDIAGQTNLLALNATIEAARAGEAGKGFAVVASEVKSLATQTAKATDDISLQVKSIQTATTDAVTAIKAITGTIARINEIATTIASAVEQQGAATREIARNVQQAATGTTEVSSNIAGVTKAAADTGAASTEVLGSAGELAKQGEILRAHVTEFLTRIRAA